MPDTRGTPDLQYSHCHRQPGQQFGQEMPSRVLRDAHAKVATPMPCSRLSTIGLVDGFRLRSGPPRGHLPRPREPNLELTQTARPAPHISVQNTEYCGTQSIWPGR
jgi:hypothetical protein